MADEDRSSPDGSGAASDRPPRAWLAVAAALTAVAVAHSSALGGEFVWDDRFLLADDRVQHLAPLLEYLRGGFWDAAGEGAATRVFYRPLTTLSLAIDHAIHGANPAGYHLSNLALHLLNTALLVRLLSLRRVPILGACLAATLWALLPRLSEAADWVSGRTDLLAATGVLAALAARPREPDPHRPPLIAAALLLLGLLAKEVALAGVIALVAGAAVRPPGEPGRSRWRWPCATLGAAGAVVALWALLRARAVGWAPHTAGPPLVDRARLALEALGTYLWSTLDALQPCAQIGLLDSPRWSLVALGVVGLLLGVALILRARNATKSSDVEAFALLVASVAPVLHLYPLPTNVVAADRFLYLPLAAATLLLAPRLARRGPRALTAFAALGMALAAGATTYLRAPVWTDEVKLWSETLRCAHPENPQPLASLAGLHHRAGDYARAIELYRTAIHRAGLMPGAPAVLGYPRLVEGLSGAQGMAGDHRAELEAARLLVEAHPEMPRLRHGHALALMHAGALEPARRELEAATAHLPATSPAHTLLAGWPEVEAAARSLSGQPGPAARARALARLGRRADAEALWEPLFTAPDTAPPERAEATEFLLLFGSAERLPEHLAAARALGLLSPELELAAAERIDLIDRLAAVRRELGW